MPKPSDNNIKNDADPNAITIQEARTRIQDKLHQCNEQETIACAKAYGRIVAHDVFTNLQVPPFRASAMDGYAVRASECGNPLTLSGESLAGHPGDNHIPALTAQRITTGARVPDDADAVVQQENVTLDNGSIVVNSLPGSGLNIRTPGSDTTSGSLLLSAGERISASQQALLASQGITQVAVWRKIRIAVFSTGDELVEPGATLRVGQINDANRALLLALLDDPASELTDLGIASDSLSAIQSIIDATHDADLVISSGGVSVGDADYVKAALEKNGSMDIWKIAMKPGRPLTFGFLDPEKAFFGLPGNPVSAAITCLLFVRPAIDFMCGTTSRNQPALELPLKGNLHKNPGRVEYQRARMARDEESSQWYVTTTGVQDSHVLQSLQRADCLIELAVDSTGAKDGDVVTVVPFTHYSRSIL